MSRLLRWLDDQRHALRARYWAAHLSAALRRKAKRPVKRRTP